MDNLFFDGINPANSLSSYQSLAMIALLVWSLAWKGSALWHAAKNEEKLWYFAILVINIVGLLEIVYLFFLSKKKITPEQAVANSKSLLDNLLTPASSKKGKTK